MNMNEKASAIIEKLGGKENVSNLQHCATRLRFKIKDLSKVDTDGLKNLEGVMGIREQGDGIQVIIGQDVEDVFDAINAQYSFTASAAEPAVKKDDSAEKTSQANPKKKQSLFMRLMAILSDCLVPMLPALIAAGMTTALLTVCNTFGWISADSETYKVLNLMGSAVLYFIPFYVVWGAARKFDVSPVIPFAVMAVLMHPDFTSLAAEGSNYVHLFGLPIRMFSYSSTILPAIFVVLLQKYIGGWIHKHMWKKIAVFMEPLCTFLILCIIMMVFLGPIGGYIGDWLGKLIIHGSDKFAWLICFILGGFGNFLVGTGMHYVMIPAVIAIFTQLGYDSFYGGACMAGAFALAGAVLGAFFKSKDQKRKQIFGTTGVTALIGVAEPAIYGVFFKYRSVMVADMIAGGLAGIISGLLGVDSYAMAPAGIFTIPSFAGSTFVHLLIVIAVGFSVGFVLSFIMYSDKQEED